MNWIVNSQRGNTDNKYLERDSTLLSVGKVPVRLPWGPISLCQAGCIKKTMDNEHCWGTFIRCSWNCKLMQSLWKPIWRFLKYLKTEVSCDAAIPLLGIYLSNGLKSISHRDTCIFYSDLLPHCSQWLGNGTALTSINRWMAKKYGIYKHNRNLFSHREKWNHGICREMDGTGNRYV